MNVVAEAVSAEHGSAAADRAPNGTALTAYLRSLPKLRHRAAAGAAPCKMCGAATERFCEIDFNVACNGAEMFEPSNIMVPYVRCIACDFLFTTFCDEWTTQDFADLIYNAEYIMVDGEYDGTRATRDAAAMADLLSGAKAQRLLDYGSGLGHFAQAMVARGFEQVDNYDPFSSPARPSGQFDIITSFETIEHSAQPVQTLRDMLSLMKPDGCLMIGQTLQPNDIEQQRGRWWYLGPRNGHISTFSENTIRRFADSEGLVFDNFGGLFALSRPQRSEYLEGLLAPRALPSYQTFLYAPATADVHGWLDLEGGRDSFRWTGTAEISLGSVEIDRPTEFVLPFLHVIDQPFLDQSQLRVGEELIPLRRGHRALRADYAPSEAGRRTVSLITPPPIAPSDTGTSSDTRTLGIAICCAPPPALNAVRTNRW